MNNNILIWLILYWHDLWCTNITIIQVIQPNYTDTTNDILIRPIIN